MFYNYFIGVIKVATALYMRVSDEKQEDGVSFETQDNTLYRFCDYKGFKNIKVYKEVKSARTLNRDMVNKLIKDVKNGRIKRIVIYRLDRLTRSLRDLMNLLYLFEEYDCELHSTSENIDTRSPSGRMLVQVLGIIGEWESANTSVRVRANMNTRASAGIWQSSIPFGFYHGDDKRLKVKEDEANILREAFNLVLEGESFSSAESKISEAYGLNWSSNYLARKLKMHTTHGNIQRNGKLYKNTHEPLIGAYTKNKLLEILEENKTGRRSLKHVDLFRRKIKCMQCNKIMSMVARSHNNYEKTYYSYTCNDCYYKRKKFVSVSESQLESSMLNYLSAFKIDDVDKTVVPDDQKDIQRIKRRIDAIKKERERVQRAWIKERITDDELDMYQSELDIESENLNRELLSLNNNKSFISKEELKEMIIYLEDAYKGLTKEERKTFIQKHIRNIEFDRKLIKGYKKKYSVTVTNIEFY